MAEEFINKLIFNNETKFDLTGDTVTPQSLILGATAHAADGRTITGTADFSVASSTSVSPVTDSADGMVQGLTVYGSSEVDGGNVVSVGENGLTVTTSDSDNSASTSAIFTTALPLRGIDDMSDILTVSAATGSVTSKFGAVDLSTLTWEGMGITSAGKPLFKAAVADMQPAAMASVRNKYILCSAYSVSSETNYMSMRTMTCLRVSGNVIVCDDRYNNIADFQAAVTGKFIYPLATETVAPLTSAELSAFRSLRTFSGTTNVALTDDPEFSLDYLRNTDNGQAVADIQLAAQSQIDALAARVTVLENA